MSGEEMHPRLCSNPKLPERVLPVGIDPTRARLIRELEKKWVNGSVLSYCFLDEPDKFKGAEEQKKVARDGFNMWKNLGIGVMFEEVSDPSKAMILIGFLPDDGFWSLIGRDILNEDYRKQFEGRTMNLDQHLMRQPRPIDVATHEIGHSLGFPHEHQNPKAGIKWNEDAVYEWASRTQGWDKDMTDWNIIRKIQPDEVEGSSWDKDSIMHYHFEPGLILEPKKYRNGLTPAGGLSKRDITWVRTFYPPLKAQDYEKLTIGTPVSLNFQHPGEQKNFFFVPQETRTYDLQTSGENDTVMVLFEEKNGKRTQLDAKDDSAQDDFNAHLRIKLIKGNKYVLSIRLYHGTDTSVKVW